MEERILLGREAAKVEPLDGGKIWETRQMEGLNAARLTTVQIYPFSHRVRVFLFSLHFFPGLLPIHLNIEQNTSYTGRRVPSCPLLLR